MSLSHQYGYNSYVDSGSPLASQLLPPTSSSSSSPTMSSPCCENGRSLVNPHTGQTVCSCQYPTGLLTYSRVGLSDPVYPPSAYSTAQGYMPLATDPTPFYSSLTLGNRDLYVGGLSVALVLSYLPENSPYELKEAGERWRNLGQSPGCYPYDTAAMAPYPYPNAFGGMDINSAARRKNATRENTNTLKAWLYEHRKNPYPTKGEKIMLAIITKMTLTQVSTWFANARRRLKKENKMTWSPRNKPGDVDDDDSKDKADDGDSEEETAPAKSGKDEKKCFDRESQNQDSSTDVSTSSSNKKMFEIRSDLSHHTSAQISNPCHLSDQGLPRQANSYQQPSDCTQGYGQHLPAPIGYISPCVPGGHVLPSNGNLATPKPQPSSMDSSSSVKSPESLCSNSDDSGLSDANCGYPETQHGVMDNALRPKIWSLAHVATSDVNYAMPSGSTINNNNNVNCSILTRNINTHHRGPQMGPMSNGSLLQSHMGNGNLGHDSTHPGNPLSPSSGIPTPSSVTSVQYGMPQWGTMYGGSPGIGAPYGKSSCQDSFFPSMYHGGHMTSAHPAPFVGLHCSSPSSSYNQNLGTHLSYYNSPKPTLE